MHNDAYSDGRTEDDNVIADNREIMLIRCLVIEPGRSWVVWWKESASDNWGGTQNETGWEKKMLKGNRIKKWE